MSEFGLNPIRMYGKSHVTSTLSANHPEVGAEMRDGDEVYVWVYNNGNSQISKGQGAIVSALTGYSVTVSSTTSVDWCVGVVKHSTLTTGTYGWLLKKGFGPCAAGANSGIAAAGILTLGDNGVMADMGSVATGYIGMKVGKCVLATASAGVGEAYYSIY